MAEAKQVVLPELGAPTADTHAHLDMLDDPVAALFNAGRANVTFVATVVDLTEEPEKTLDGLVGWDDEAAGRMRAEGLDAEYATPEVGVIVGMHPHNAKHWSDAMEARLREVVASDPRVVGLGELGLDFHYDHSPRDDQSRMFARQIELAHELDLPVTVHLREAHAEGYETLRDLGVPSAGAIIHCFTEDPQTAEQFLSLGVNVYISFAGPVTFNKGDQIREATKIVPLDRLLAETDCPFLAPAPYRGTPNEPAFVKLNIAAIAAARGEDPTAVAEAVLRNARRVFRRS